jgi:hypothetical protein
VNIDPSILSALSNALRGLIFGIQRQNTSICRVDPNNDFHKSVLAALSSLDVETREDGPLILLGTLTEAILPAMALWLKEISDRQVPGIVLIDTVAQSLQDTVVWQAIEEFGLTELTRQLRVLDLREAKLPVALSVRPHDWVEAIAHALPPDIVKEFEDSAGRHLMERLCHCYGVSREGLSSKNARGDVSFRCLDLAFSAALSRDVCASNVWKAFGEVDGFGIQSDMDAFVSRRSDRLLAALNSLISSLRERQFSQHYLMWGETQRRPMVVLFDSRRPETCVLAAVCHAMFYWRYVGFELRMQGLGVRPTLYVNELSNNTIPRFIEATDGSHTQLILGCRLREDLKRLSYLLGRGLFLDIKDQAIIFSGNRASYAQLPVAKQKRDVSPTTKLRIARIRPHPKARQSEKDREPPVDRTEQNGNLRLVGRRPGTQSALSNTSQIPTPHISITVNGGNPSFTDTGIQMSYRYRQTNLDDAICYLESHGMPAADIEAFKRALIAEPTKPQNGAYGPQVESWRSSMGEKAASGLWNVAQGVAANVLAQAFAKAFGVS